MESLEFASTVRTLGGTARTLGLVVPGFRSPPKVPGVTRTFKRRDDGTCTVAVVLRGRPDVEVTADLIEGILVANDLTGGAAVRTRTALWEAARSSATVAGDATVHRRR